MTIALNDLTELYAPSYFKEFSLHYKLNEKQDDPANLSEVNVKTSGSGIFITPNFLDDCKSLFRKIDRHLSFRDINDGTFLLEKDDTQYIIYVELKSGYAAVKKKAIKQIPVSSVKIKSLLRNIQVFHSDDFIELGLIISFPPVPEDKYDSKNNDMVLNHKLNYMSVQMGSEDIIDKELRSNKKTCMKAGHFPNLSQDKLHEDIKFKQIMVYHCPVCGNGDTVDLDTILF